MRIKMLISLVLVLCLAGCATFTTKSAKTQDQAMDIADLRARLDESEQTISELRAQVDRLEQTQYSEEGIGKDAPKVSATPKRIQTALKNAGYYDSKIDGKIGKLSRRGIEEFQADKGLKVDGIVGKQTWAKLSEYLD